jgi:tetratricopeptide (TPR) repeat protein
VAEKPGFAAPDWLLALGLVLATVLAYHSVLRAGFIWDDDDYVTQNPLLTAPDGLWRIWFSRDSPSQYFPLTYTTFYIEHSLWGLNPLGYHCVNLLLHAANALLVWRLLARLRIPAAWLAAALFALHPVQVESVAWVTERKNVLMGFFFLLSLLAWTRFIDETSKRPRRFYALSLLFCALALSAKTTACTLPAALLLVLWLKKMPVGWRRLAQVAPFMALGIGMGLVTVWWERFHQGTQGALFSIGPLERVLIAGRALWFYAGKLLWPANLAFIYPRWTISASDPFAYCWLAALAVLAMGIWRARKWAGRGLEVAALFFAVTLSPVLGFIMLYTFRYSFVADHYQYLACLGPLALAAAALERGLAVLAARTPLLKPVCCAVLLTALGALTWGQCRQYAGPETLWRATLAVNPGCWLAHNNLGLMLLDQGKTDDALAHFKTALALNPDFELAHNNLGNALKLKGDLVQAILQYRIALDLQPDYVQGRNNLANALLHQGDVVEAIAQFRKALAIDPDFMEAHSGLANALMARGEVADAITHYERAVVLRPDFPEARYNLGLALARNGQVVQAIAQFQKALDLRPNFPQARSDLGNALILTGDLTQAVAQFRKALDQAQAQKNDALAATLQQQIKLYEAGHPMRQAK